MIFSFPLFQAQKGINFGSSWLKKARQPRRCQLFSHSQPFGASSPQRESPLAVHEHFNGAGGMLRPTLALIPNWGSGSSAGRLIPLDAAPDESLESPPGNLEAPGITGTACLSLQGITATLGGNLGSASQSAAIHFISSNSVLVV
jgi:hypothetical protein